VAEAYESPWVKAKTGKPERCHYGCGKFATLTEPGKPWKAHKVCAEGTPSQGPLGSWDGEDRKVVDDPGPIGCGPKDGPRFRGRACAGLGTLSMCMLCPRSPTYWRRDATA
jgi:hypothetical protein